LTVVYGPGGEGSRGREARSVYAGAVLLTKADYVHAGATTRTQVFFRTAGPGEELSLDEEMRAVLALGYDAIRLSY
jgi:hypothetical protein